MHFGTQARADWRALISAAFIGSGVGLSLGAVYMAGGMGQAVADHGRAERIAQATDGALSDSALRQGLDPSVMALAKAHDPITANPVAGGSTAAKLAGVDPDAQRVAQAKPTRARELECLTEAVYFEARGESARGQAAVATVIMNRVKNPNFPKTVCGVVYQGAARRHGCQFSFACDGMVERVMEGNAWDRARQVAARTLSGVVLRDVGSATHFHTTGVSPGWGSRMLRTAQVGLHVFYRFNPHAPRPVQAADDAPVFVSAPVVNPPELRIANAMLTPVAAEEKPATETKPALKAEKVEAAAPTSGPIARTETSAPPKGDAATAS
ncbi:cell wall hydrolase [Phenylobacterium sp. LjRoot225]|uniref:cell wall hydrolase n=1 Tax=Phenylobacterium sp. LjRoot225 TaxID=3342285 RepID=UPI003ECFA17E